MTEKPRSIKKPCSKKKKNPKKPLKKEIFNVNPDTKTEVQIQKNEAPKDAFIPSAYNILSRFSTNLESEECIKALIYQGFSNGEIMKMTQCNYSRLYKLRRNFDQVRQEVEDYISLRDLENKRLLQKMDEASFMIIEELLSRNPQSIDDKDLLQMLKAVSLTKKTYYEIERKQEGKDNVPIRNIWNVIINKSEEKLNKELEAEVISFDKPASQITQGIEGNLHNDNYAT